MAAEELNLSGFWKGIFNYPRSLPANQFDAELREHEGALTGETFERGNSGRNKGKPLHAMIEGHRNGYDVSFVKRYDEFELSMTPIYYSGKLSNDGNEISGIWNIPSHWSGTFLMIRPKPNLAILQQLTTESVK